MNVSRLLRVAAFTGILSAALVAKANDDPPQGLTAVATSANHTAKVTGTLVLPGGQGRIRGVIVVLRWALGTQVFNDPEWRQLADELHCGLLGLLIGNTEVKENRPVEEQAIRNAAIGGAEAFDAVLADLARQSGHPELQTAKLLLWGHSAAGSFVATFAAMKPDRTIGFIRYHSHSRGLPLDLKTLSRQPALLFAGEKDDVAGVEDTENLWRSGRALHAPWTFAIEPGASHGSAAGVKNANKLAIPWVRGVFAQRVSNDRNLVTLKEGKGWYGLASSGEIAPAKSFHGPPHDASWLPDEITANSWRALVSHQSTFF